MNTLHLNIEGMSCGHCQKNIEEAFSAKTGVSEVHVSLEEGSAKVTFDESKLTEAEVKGVLDASAYSIIS